MKTKGLLRLDKVLEQTQVVLKTVGQQLLLRLALDLVEEGSVPEWEELVPITGGSVLAREG